MNCISFQKIILALAILVLSSNESIAQQTAQKFTQQMNYLLALPDGYEKDTTTKWPLVIFLHGSGERGNDLEKVKKNGPPKLVEQGRKFPFILVSPQAGPEAAWDAETLYRMEQYLKKEYRVNSNKVYLTGLSMGGYGTWDLAMKHPEEFAAIAPICGGGDASGAWKLRNIPIWCFHGAKDNVVPLAASENMVKAAKEYNHDVKFTVYPNANHNSWDESYNNDSLYTWLLSKNRYVYKEAPVKPAVLKPLSGKYIGTDKDTVSLVVAKGGLLARTRQDTIPLKSSGNNIFFIDAYKPMDIRFQQTKSGNVSFLFLGDRKLLYQKIK
ncbi:MAG TPA: dienelactone hydrolase family protein [Flavisolibacter sp.]|nr:dienelactone hydrolase family protein [Flavisolibacter sp.]